MKNEKITYKVKNVRKNRRKLGSLTPGYTTELYSPQDGVRKRVLVPASKNEGIIGILMRKHNMKSWHDNV